MNSIGRIMAEQTEFKLTASPGFEQWLAGQNTSIAFTTYQAKKLFLIGVDPTGKLSIFERTLDRCMGMWATSQTLYVSTLYQLWRFENVLEPGDLHNGYDRLYIPQLGYITGNLDIHDIALDSNGRVVFANTLSNCLAHVSETHSMTPCWRPPFVSGIGFGDRCHLNGFAMRDGKPAYVTCASRSDVKGGWRAHRKDGGLVVDVDSNSVILNGLSMPHSPRWYVGKLWLLDSGTGYLGYVDPEHGKFERVAFCPGFLRGLAFIGNYALIGSSLARNKTFTGLYLEDELAKRDMEPRCGLFVINLLSGEVSHSIQLEGVVSELYDVATLPGVRRPMAIGFKSDEINHMISVGPKSTL
jgi:uncharacterized protein (TIGR03032 family)